MASAEERSSPATMLGCAEAALAWLVNACQLVVWEAVELTPVERAAVGGAPEAVVVLDMVAVLTAVVVLDAAAVVVLETT